VTGGIRLIVGTYGPADRSGIHLLMFAGDRLRMEGSFAGVANPSYLALHPDGSHLYAVSEVGLTTHGSGGAVHGFAVRRPADSFELVPSSVQSSEGDHPCHLRIHPSGKWLVVTNYGTGTTAVLPILGDGRLGPAAAVPSHEGRGPHPERQEGPHPHSSIFSPDGRYLVVADLGIDRLVLYSFDPATGAPEPVEEIATVSGGGPRHLALHPDGRHLFAVDELTSQLTLLEWDGPRLFVLESIRTVAGSGAVSSIAADVHLARWGDRVYVSNRGDDSLAVFSFSRQAGLRRLTVQPAGGRGPRSFVLTPDGRHVVVANRDSNLVCALPIRAGRGDVGTPISSVPVPEPACVVVDAPARAWLQHPG